MDQGEPNNNTNKSPIFSSNNEPAQHAPLFNTHRYRANNQSNNVRINNAPSFFSNAMFNGQNNVSQVMSTAEPTRKKNKLPIVMAVILTAIAVVCIVVFLIVPTAVNNAESEKLSKAEKAWNKLGNYIIYGEVKEDALPDDISINKIKLNRNSKTGYFDDLEAVYSNISEVMKNSEYEERYKEIGKNIRYMKNISVVSYYSDVEIRDMIIRYIEPESLASTIVKDISENDAYEKGMKELVRQYYLYVASQQKAYIDSGCIVDSALQSECAQTVNQNNQFDENYREVYDKIIAHASECREEIVELLKGGQNE